MFVSNSIRGAPQQNTYKPQSPLAFKGDSIAYDCFDNSSKHLKAPAFKGHSHDEEKIPLKKENIKMLLKDMETFLKTAPNLSYEDKKNIKEYIRTLNEYLIDTTVYHCEPPEELKKALDELFQGDFTDAQKISLKQEDIQMLLKDMETFLKSAPDLSIEDKNKIDEAIRISNEFLINTTFYYKEPSEKLKKALDKLFQEVNQTEDKPGLLDRISSKITHIKDNEKAEGRDIYYYSYVGSGVNQAISGGFFLLSLLKTPMAETFERMGWASMGALGFVATVGSMGNAFKSKQPSMFLADVIGLLGSAMLIIDPGASAFAITFLSLATYSAGLARKINNDFNPDRQRVEFDMTFLTDPEFWKKAVTSKEGAKDLGKSMYAMVKYIAEDHWEMLKSTKKSAIQTYQRLTGKRKEKPDFFTTNPVPEQRYVTGMSYYAGSIPIIIFGGDAGLISKTGNAFLGLAGLTGSYGFWAIGKKHKKGMVKNALLAFMPLRMIGGFLGTNIEGILVRTPGNLALKAYFANDIQDKNKEKEKEKENLKKKEAKQTV